MGTIQGGAAYSIAPDHLGAPYRIVNSSNTQVWFWDHDPYGNGAPTAAAGFSHRLRFPGQVYDSESGLHSNGPRDYDPRLGRYVESDPIGLDGGINTYAYANNNPVNAIDPLGLARYELDGDENYELESRWGSGAKRFEDIAKNLARLWDQLRSLWPTVERQAERSGAVNFSRELQARDLGIKGTVQELRGTFAVKDGVATMRVDMIRGEIHNPLEVVRNMSDAAAASGASSLRIEGTIANERLFNVLQSRYGLTSSGATDVITIPLR